MTKTTADLPEALRKVLDDTPVGHLTPPEVTKQGIEMVVLCSRKPTMIDTPKKREIREKMYSEKFEKTSKAYLQEISKAGGRVFVESPDTAQFNGMPLLLLTTKGTKSGVSRVNPLAYIRDGDRYVIIASFAGAPKSPPWYHNLVAHPNVHVEVGSQSFDARAEVVKEPERTALYSKVEAAMPVFSEYKKKTQRTIPIVALRPVR